MAILNIENNNLNANFARSNSRAKFSVSGGVLTSNVGEPIVIFEDCSKEGPSLNLSCPDNSMYLPVI
jgi:hypothetical protein